MKLEVKRGEVNNNKRGLGFNEETSSMSSAASVIPLLPPTPCPRLPYAVLEMHPALCVLAPSPCRREG